MAKEILNKHPLFKHTIKGLGSEILEIEGKVIQYAIPGDFKVDETVPVIFITIYKNLFDEGKRTENISMQLSIHEAYAMVSAIELTASEETKEDDKNFRNYSGGRGDKGKWAEITAKYDEKEKSSMYYLSIKQAKNHFSLTFDRFGFIGMGKMFNELVSSLVHHSNDVNWQRYLQDIRRQAKQGNSNE